LTYSTLELTKSELSDNYAKQGSCIDILQPSLVRYFSQIILVVCSIKNNQHQIFLKQGDIEHNKYHVCEKHDDQRLHI